MIPNALRFLPAPASRVVGYRSIELAAPCRAFNARGRVLAVDAVAGVTITRVTDDEADVFLVEGVDIVPGLEIEASNVTAGVRIAPLAIDPPLAGGAE